MTPVYFIDELETNKLYIKRDDLIPFSFGGNKARKAELFFEEFDGGDYDCVVTYGTSSSNHCRVIANECSRRGVECYIIRPNEASGETYNSILVEILGAKIVTVSVDEGFQKQDELIESLKNEGKKPFLIEGGGHGFLGTKAYVQCYEEIIQQEKELGVYFDYVFFASGTGTTHAGLLCGQIIHKDFRKIVGISIARKNPRGSEVVESCVESYFGESIPNDLIKEKLFFIDDYAYGYGKSNSKISKAISDCMIKYGIPMDETYTGKAFYGMCDYVRKENIKGKTILFIHTGGTPLFFDALKGLTNDIKRGNDE